MIDDIVRDNCCGRGHAVFNVGFNDTVVSLFNDIRRFSVASKPGFQPSDLGRRHLFTGTDLGGHATVHPHQSDKRSAGQQSPRHISRSRLRQDLPEQVAEELQVSYSLFRKAFKQQTGVAPGQYLLDLKLQFARQLLADPTIQIKEIAYRLNMESPLYFGKLFKDKLGVTPSEYRRSSHSISRDPR
ncbi:helix-turn-helix transcriptional regulator [Puia sp. P3]|uniref:helix-turn-helix transcriptional regulator n=1 Tax=Puia sp. P3 TaxID=3423952 RepID=UPI003D678FB6